MSIRVLGGEELKWFDKDGFLSISQITTAEEIARIRTLYDRLFEQKVGWDKGDFFDFAGVEKPGSVATVPQLLNPSKYESGLKKTIFRTNALAIARQLLGSSAELVFEHAMLKPAKSGGETPWHQDEAFYPKFTNYRSITFWLPLQDVDTVNGCLDFIPGSNHESLLKHQSINNDPRIHGLEALGADANRKVSCPLQIGSATVHGYRTLHHAGPNLSDGPRRAYALGFGIRSKDYTVHTEFPWNTEKITARAKRADESTSQVQRYVKDLKSYVKSVIR